MNDSYTKAACGCAGGWKSPGRLESAILNAVGIAGGALAVAGILRSLAQVVGVA